MVFQAPFNQFLSKKINIILCWIQYTSSAFFSFLGFVQSLVWTEYCIYFVAGKDFEIRMALVFVFNFLAFLIKDKINKPCL